jgi:biopolymer transport protein ExbB
MRRIANSKFLVVLLALLLGTVVMVTTAHAQAPAAGADAGAAAPPPESSAILVVFKLVAKHIVDPVTITILLLSVIALTFIIQGFIRNRGSVMLPEPSTNQIRELIGQKKFKELIEFTETDPSFVSKALNPALKRAPSFSGMKEAMETALGEQTAEQFRKIEYLNIIGNLGPLLGLLGTVMGMVQAFDMMQQQGGSAKPADLAGGISTALTHTFMGLFLAVPCLGAFGILRTIVDRLTIRGALIAEEMLLMVKPAEAKPAAPGAPRAVAGAVPQPGLPGARKPGLPTPAPAPVISG